MWAQRAARARLLAGRYPASREILLFYAEVAEWQGRAAGGPEDSLAGLRELVCRSGPVVLRNAASDLTGLPGLDAPPPFSFFARVARQPFLRTCPWCPDHPQVGALVSRGEGQALELICALCFGRREFPRGRCPACREERIVWCSAPEFEHLRVQACEACRAYLLLVDLSREPQAIPEVDELAALPLDLWAQEHEYRKICRNLAGI